MPHPLSYPMHSIPYVPKSLPTSSMDICNDWAPVAPGVKGSNSLHKKIPSPHILRICSLPLESRDEGRASPIHSVDLFQRVLIVSMESHHPNTSMCKPRLLNLLFRTTLSLQDVFVMFAYFHLSICLKSTLYTKAAPTCNRIYCRNYLKK